MNRPTGKGWSLGEVEAHRALEDAIEVLRAADARCEAAGYGSEVMGPLDDALKSLRYALNVIEDR